MCELLIIRHAVAHERDASAWPNDELRPLTAEGSDKFRKAARGLARVADVPEELLCSPLVRARQTAAILEREAAFPRALELDVLRPGTAISVLVRALHERRSASIAIVGHEPDLGQLLASLLGGPVVPLKKGAVAQLAFEQRVEEGAGQLLALLPPRVLRALARKG